MTRASTPSRRTEPNGVVRRPATGDDSDAYACERLEQFGRDISEDGVVVTLVDDDGSLAHHLDAAREAILRR